MKRVRFTITVSLLLLSSLASQAQNGINSPYSRYGFGMMGDRALGFNKGMAGVAQGFRNGQEINVANPASYSSIDSLTALIDFGMTFQNGNFKMGDLQKNAKNTSIDYFAFQFRAFKNLGMSLGILPYTNINYSFKSSAENISGTEDITSSYKFSGSGGLHQVYFGAGWKVFGSPLSIGANISYLYGDYSHTSTIAYSDTAVYSMVRGYAADISTWKFDAGLQYTLKLGKKDDLTIGATYGLGHEVKNRAVRNTETINSSGAVQGITSDTIRNAFELPHTIDAGFTFRHGRKWRLGGDFSMEKWSQCKFPSQDYGNGQYISQKGQLYDRMKVALGYDITPNVISPKLFNRMTYKIGGYYSKSYACADPTGTVTDKPYEFGVTAGVSIPISNRNLWYNSPKINFAVQWVHSDIPYLNTVTRQKSSLVENYLKFSLGLTFSERWFYKWKVQ